MFARYKDSLDGELRSALYLPSPAREAGEVEQGHIEHGEHGQGPEPLLVPLYRMLQYHLGWANEMGKLLALPVSQGKAFRPTLCLFTCEALREDWNKALPAAAALELIHNFSLIHDDIQDQDLERRHRPTVWSIWGQHQALVAGNTMRCIADTTAWRLSERGVSEGRALRASSLLTRAYLDMIYGQSLDLAFEGSLDIKIEDYLTMIGGKTGALIRCSMEMGAVVASDDEREVRAFANCSRYLGRVFQIQDDVLGIWGDEATTGKAVGNDILRKKKSFPIVYAMEVAEDAARQKLVEAYSKEELDSRDVEDVLTVLEELDVVRHAQKMTTENAGLAIREVNDIHLPSWARREIEELVGFLTAREY